ncbi:Retrovirus-related Pol polyprotein from transposon TNT 1-94 [Durusdinium trenchii]|uniref:Retrovirus-related Pol polyprotein from transposon TNT 1-94 n=1 Tax=Durusdinium trenchii TaxID=1381693 RepID=A0ABP0K9B1_9DINO
MAQQGAGQLNVTELVARMTQAAEAASEAAKATAAAVQARQGSSQDWTKIIQKPPVFEPSNREAELSGFRDWWWQVEQYLLAIDQNFLTELETVKSKGKSKDKGGGKSQQRQDTCNICGRFGHSARDCWNKDKVRRVDDQGNDFTTATSPDAHSEPATTQRVNRVEHINNINDISIERTSTAAPSYFFDLSFDSFEEMSNVRAIFQESDDLASCSITSDASLSGDFDHFFQKTMQMPCSEPGTEWYTLSSLQCLDDEDHCEKLSFDLFSLHEYECESERSGFHFARGDLESKPQVRRHVHFEEWCRVLTVSSETVCARVDTCNELHEIVLDSGSDATLIPSGLQHCGWLAPVQESQLRDAQGGPIRTQGVRDIELVFTAVDGVEVVVRERCHVSDKIDMPLISYGKLLKNGWNISNELDGNFLSHSCGARIPVSFKHNSLIVHGRVRAIYQKVTCIPVDIPSTWRFLPLGWTSTVKGQPLCMSRAQIHVDPDYVNQVLLKSRRLLLPSLKRTKIGALRQYQNAEQKAAKHSTGGAAEHSAGGASEGDKTKEEKSAEDPVLLQLDKSVIINGMNIIETSTIKVLRAACKFLRISESGSKAKLWQRIISKLQSEQILANQEIAAQSLTDAIRVPVSAQSVESPSPEVIDITLRCDNEPTMIAVQRMAKASYRHRLTRAVKMIKCDWKEHMALYSLLQTPTWQMEGTFGARMELTKPIRNKSGPPTALLADEAATDPDSDPEEPENLLMTPPRMGEQRGELKDKQQKDPEEIDPLANQPVSPAPSRPLLPAAFTPNLERVDAEMSGASTHPIPDLLEEPDAKWLRSRRAEEDLPHEDEELFEPFMNSSLLKSADLEVIGSSNFDQENYDVYAQHFQESSSSEEKWEVDSSELWYPFSESEPQLSEQQMSYLDEIANKVEVQRLKNMNVLQDSNGFSGELDTSLSAKFVRTWRKKTLDGVSMYLRRSRLCAREFNFMEYRTDVYSPSSTTNVVKLLPCLAMSNSFVPGGCLGSLDITDAYLQVPQLKPRIVRVQGTELSFVILKCLPGQRDAAKLWYLFFTDALKRLLGATVCLEQPALVKCGNNAVLLLHVDDVLFYGNEQWISSVMIPALKSEFKMSCQYVPRRDGGSFEFLKRLHVFEPGYASLKIFPERKHARALFERLSEINGRPPRISKTPSSAACAPHLDNTLHDADRAADFRSLVGVMWVTLQGAFDGGHRDRYRCFCEGFSYLAQPGESYFELRGQTLLSFTNPVVGSQREIANIPRSSVRGVADDIDAIDPVPEADEEDDENRASLRRRFLSTSAAAPSSSNGVPEHWLEERLLLASRRARALPGDEPDSSDDDALMYTP